MASSIPAQTRTVDPFASYNSDTVNKLTKMASRGDDGIMARNDLDIVPDSTSPLDHVLMRPGIIYKDDMLIDFTQEHVVDFTDPDHYVSFGSGFNEAGTYYIVMQYTYVKSRPAPDAKIKILKPSQIPHPSVGTSLFFLKAVIVIFNGVSFEISSLSDADPGDPTVNRDYVPLFFGGETFLPTHDPTTDIGRVVYETSTNTFWFGYSDRWGKISAGVEVTLNTDTTGVAVGSLCYTDSNGDAVLAYANVVDTGAEMVVVEVGTAVLGTGRAIMTGFVEDVPIETGVIVNVGDILYLSATEPGKVTNIKTLPVRQVVGRAVTGGNSSLPIDILFFPRDVHSIAISGTIEPGDWVGPDGDGLYFDNIDITPLDVDSTHPSVLVNIFDDADNKKISPADIEMISLGNAVRIYSPSNAYTWNYIISSGGGSTGVSGGGGTTDHALLFNLDYDSSGHDDGSFAAGGASGVGGHDNTDHLDTYIEATDVTYGTLNANGDVGDVAGQVAIGDHTHLLADTHDYNDVPTGEIILFEKDTSVTGYTLQTDVDDQLIYITKGSGAGGDAGGSVKTGATWSQPNHNHPTGSHTLTITEIPSHQHFVINTATRTQNLSAVNSVSGNYNPASNDNFKPNIAAVAAGANAGLSSSTGGGNSHNHGSTSGSATSSSWRPLGRNMTRQLRV